MAGKRGAGTRFLTTVLMTDIVGSTEHAAELGDSGWRELVQLHHQAVRAALRRHAGREIDTAGDGFFAIFDAPAAAVVCALETSVAVKDLGLDIRAGLHVGEVEQIGSKVGGLAVPIAARIMALADAGEVLASGTVRDMSAGAGLRFEDRGTHQLKGVPDEWHVYRAVPTAADDTPVADSAGRRMAAVRRAQARPIWQRHPRAIAGGVLALALVVIAAGLLVWQPWLPPALAEIDENSVGVIDAGRAVIVDSISVGGRPGGIAIGLDSAWVANTADDTVSKLDLATRSVVRVIDVGDAPTGVAVAQGSIWVANSGERTVTRINEATGRVVDTITVGNGPIALAADGDGVWVANARDNTIVRLDASGQVGQPVGVAAGPIAIAVDATGVWVASEIASAITRVEPTSGTTLAAPILLQPARPTALAAGAGAIWVTASDGSLTRIDPLAYRVTDTISLGGVPTAVLVTERDVWVADRQGEIRRLDVGDLSAEPENLATGGSPSALSAAERDVWLPAGPPQDSHFGGTLREVITEAFPHGLDPALSFFHDAADLQADGLVGYRRAGGVAGATLLPSLARAIPRPTDGGRRYAFELRPGLVYSTGQPVQPADFRRAIERNFQVADESGYVNGPFLFGSIEGADSCLSPEDGDPFAPLPVERCDLSQGIEVNDAAGTITFTLLEPDPQFLHTLTLPNAYPIPEGVDMRAPIEGALPGTGPYTVSTVSPTEITFTRNPHFNVWDAQVRPPGYPDQIVWHIGTDAEALAAMVERGEADVMELRGPNEVSPESMTRLQLNRPGQLHFASVSVRMAELIPGQPPFDNQQVRQALNLAVDRTYLAQLRGGPPAALVTCQVLPPAATAYQPYCPYTLEPDASGQWHGPDMDRARQLVTESGTAGVEVVVGPVVAPRHDFVRDYLVQVLNELGYAAVADEEYGGDAQQIGVGTFPSDLQLLTFYTCSESGEVFCDEDYDRLIDEARALEATDPPAAISKWTEVEHKLVDLGWVVPLMNEGVGFVSERVGNYQFSARYGALFDQMWVE